MNRKGYIILLDGSRGAGKSSVALIVNENIPESYIVSLDVIRHNIINSKAMVEYNSIAYEILLKQVRQLIEKGKIIIIDCGMTEDKLKMLEEITKATGIPLYKYFLDGSYDILLQRIESRHIKAGKESKDRSFYEERIKYLYDIVRSKQFFDYKFFDVEKLSAKKIADQILVQVRKEK